MLVMGRYGTRDIVRAKQFYDAIAEVLGAQRVIDRHGLIGYRGPEGVTFIIGTPREGEANVGNGTQMTFAATSRESVDAVHAKALALGGECLGPPGRRGTDIPLYACYFRDPDGNKVMVFRLEAD
jgi:catechol 2,3-dioxygenase-like lactoylglutathione lyase family enzyme